MTSALRTSASITASTKSNIIEIPLHAAAALESSIPEESAPVATTASITSSPITVQASVRSQTMAPIKSKDDIERIKDYILKHYDRFPGIRYRNYALFCMGINCGRRISDLLRLTFGDVLYPTGEAKSMVTIREKKTGKIMTFYINKAAQEAIVAYANDLRHIDLNDFLFRSRSSSPSTGNPKAISRQQAFNIMQEIEEALELEFKIGTHGLRKTFGYHIVTSSDDPMTLYSLQELYGHSSPKITLRYIGIGEEEKKNLYAGLNL